MSLQDRSRTLSRPREGNNSLDGKKLRKVGSDGSEETDNEDSEDTLAAVPSITRLLNRKKLQISKPKPPTESAPTHPSPALPEETESDLTGEVSTSSLERSLVDPHSPPAREPAVHSKAAPTTASGPKAITAARRNSATPLITWELRQLVRAKDPLGVGLVTLFNNGATSALFLSIAPFAGRDVPLFCGTATSGESSRTPIWTGMRWDPAVTPALWNYFVKSGYLELPPPGSSTNEFSHRNTLRSAFGVRPDEHLLLLRTGPLQACRGILAVISPRSLQHVLPQALGHLEQPLPKKAA